MSFELAPARVLPDYKGVIRRNLRHGQDGHCGKRCHALSFEQAHARYVILVDGDFVKMSGDASQTAKAKVDRERAKKFRRPYLKLQFLKDLSDQCLFDSFAIIYSATEIAPKPWKKNIRSVVAMLQQIVSIGQHHQRCNGFRRKQRLKVCHETIRRVCSNIVSDAISLHGGAEALSSRSVAFSNNSLMRAKDHSTP